MPTSARRPFRRITVALLGAMAVAGTAAWAQGPPPAPAPSTVPVQPIAPVQPMLRPAVPQPVLPLTVVPNDPSTIRRQAPLTPDVAPPSLVPAPPTVPSTWPQPSVLLAPVVPAPLFEFHPAATIAGDYTDNFDQTKHGTRSDVRTSLSPAATLLINGTRLRGQVTYTLSAVHDTVNDTNDVSIFHALSGLVAWDATPQLSVRVVDSLTRSDEPTQADRLDLRRGRNVFTENLFNAEAQYTVPDFQARLYYTLSTFLEEPSLTTSNTVGAEVTLPFFLTNSATVGYEYLHTADDVTLDGHRTTATLSRQVTENMGVGITGSYSIREASEEPRTFRIATLSLLSSYSVARRWWYSSTIGVSWLDSNRQEPETFFSTQSTLSYRLGQGTLSLSVDRGFSETFATGENFGVVQTQGAALTLVHPIGVAVNATASASYRQNEETGVGGGTRGERSEVIGGILAVEVQLARWLTLQGMYAHRVVSQANDGFTENRVRISLTGSF